MPVNSSTQRTSDEQYLHLFDLTCKNFLVKKEHIDEMRWNPKIVELVLLSFFEAYEKSKNEWPADFIQILLKSSFAMGQTPMSMEIVCNFSEALIRIYEKTENELKKMEAMELYELGVQKRNEVDPIVTFRNKPIRYSKISQHDHQSWDYEKLQKGFDACNLLVKQTMAAGEKNEVDLKKKRSVEKKKEREADELYDLGLEKGNEADPIINFKNKRYRYSRFFKMDLKWKECYFLTMSPNEYLVIDKQQLQECLLTLNDPVKLVKFRTGRYDHLLDSPLLRVIPVSKTEGELVRVFFEKAAEAREKEDLKEKEKLAEKKKERNRKARERKKNKKMTARESVEDTAIISETPGSSESKISEMVRKLMDFEI